MSLGVELVDKVLENENVLFEHLQRDFNRTGRVGSVREFLLKGAKNDTWNSMAGVDQDLWLCLNGTRLRNPTRRIV